YRCPAVAGELPVPRFPGVWNLDLVPNGRSQMLVFANEEQSLYSLVIPVSRGRQIEPFLESFRSRLRELFDEHEIPLHRRPDIDNVTFESRTNQRVIGSQNELIYQASWIIDGFGRTAADEKLRFVEQRLNGTPMTYLGRG